MGEGVQIQIYIYIIYIYNFVVKSEKKWEYKKTSYIKQDRKPV